jgi:Flp pilus assembly protein TadB
MSRAVAVRPLRVSGLPARLADGQEWWEDNPHRLASRLAVAKRRGEVAELGRWEMVPGRQGALVRRLKPRPTWATHARRWALLGVLGLAAVALLMVAVWVVVGALIALLPLILGFLAVALLLLRMATGHSGGCVGLHCPGCRG